MHKFFETTLVSKFIKYLLMVTPLPMCSFLNDYDIMVEGSHYIYNGKIYRCTKTGIFKGSNIELMDYLYCSDSVYCSDDLYVTDGLVKYGGKRLAKYEVVDLYTEGKDIIGFTEEFVSSKGYYDSDTHRKLGDYLRLIKSMYGLDLMSLYNCFCNIYVDNVDLSSGKLQEKINKKYKTTLVPIKFNRTYTILFNTTSPTFIKPVLYDGKLIRNTKGKFVYDNVYTSMTKVSSALISTPMYITVSNTDREAQLLEKHLYLAIQMSVTNNTPIIVLEGKVIRDHSTNVYDERIFTQATVPNMNDVFKSKSSLMSSIKNTLVGNSEVLPFSDRLIEYLIGHAIDCREEFSENVSRVTDAFGYSYGYGGSWSPQLRGQLFSKYMKLKDKRPDLNYEDILGYVDKDIEDALNRGYLRYGDK